VVGGWWLVVVWWLASPVLDQCPVRLTLSRDRWAVEDRSGLARWESDLASLLCDTGGSGWRVQ